MDLKVLSPTYHVNVNSNYTYAYQVGKLVILQIVFSASVGNGVKVMTLPDSVAMRYQTWIPICNSEGGTSYARLCAKVNGEVTVIGSGVNAGYYSSGTIPTA